MKEYVNVCIQCGGQCKNVCVHSGLRNEGGLLTSPQSAAEMQLRIPLLELQRRKREQLHELIDEAEKIGAWFYSTGQLRGPFVTFERPRPSTIQKAAEDIVAELARWYSPQELREKLAQNHYQEMYGWNWHVGDPSDRKEEAERAIETIRDALKD